MNNVELVEKASKLRPVVLETARALALLRESKKKRFNRVLMKKMQEDYEFIEAEEGKVKTYRKCISELPAQPWIGIVHYL